MQSESDAATVTSPSCANRPSDAVMRKLWGRMGAMYGGARWASAASTLPMDPDTGRLTQAADTWASALTGITAEQIGEGLRACLASNDTWVPTPMLFRARCLGIPSLAFVRLALRGKGGDDPGAFVREVWSHIDGYSMARADQRQAERMVVDAYELVSEHVMRGGKLSSKAAMQIAAPIEPARTPATEATAKQSIDELATKLGIKADPIAP
jgi:hypothetical protein